MSNEVEVAEKAVEVAEEVSEVVAKAPLSPAAKVVIGVGTGLAMLTGYAIGRVRPVKRVIDGIKAARAEADEENSEAEVKKHGRFPWRKKANSNDDSEDELNDSQVH